MITIPSITLAEPHLLRLYSDREKGDTQYYVINPSSINYLLWDEDDKIMTIITNDTEHGESKFRVPINSNEDAQNFIDLGSGHQFDPEVVDAFLPYIKHKLWFLPDERFANHLPPCG